ncbi:MAG: Leucine--tRNA ligase [Bacteroidetes bacterium ADurb.Bin139]|nr:MAG: Leucine--tRNA ligase [Bacteroidetes bacterium ADurb.Bin139]
MSDFKKIEKKWQKFWEENWQELYGTRENGIKKYILNEFPYPSGSGLHIGHAFSFTGGDVYARFKRMKGENVLFPMGWDAFGLPTENYAIKTKRKPQEVTAENTAMFKKQMKRLAFSFDWSREVNTTDPSYYKWTQWIFIKLFEKGLAYKKEMPINWCPSCKIGLANEEVVDNKCERCGAGVSRRNISQWVVKITDYADKLIGGLEGTDFVEKVKMAQINWIGKSDGARVRFKIKDLRFKNKVLEVFTTRPDTLYGATFMVVAPEHSSVSEIIKEGGSSPSAQNDRAMEIKEYVMKARSKSDMERTELSKEKTGVFSGLYAINPVTKKEIPIWISDFVLASYGTGAIMAVPAHDSRDYLFARHFNLPVIPLIQGCDVSKESFDAKEGIMCNSGFLNGMTVQQAIPAAIAEVERRKLGTRTVNYRLRDAIFSRQRYWGEPFPIYYRNGLATPLDESLLPLELPPLDSFQPSASGEPPLANARNWTYRGYPLETSTMPGFAGSSAYYLRYMDPHNSEQLVSADANRYWQDVDLYIGGTEHATGHLIYSRFWNKFLFDLGLVCKEEPFRKLVNQGMIQGRSNFVYRIKNTNTFVSLNLKDNYQTTELHVDVNLVENDRLDLEAFRKWNPEYETARFILENGEYICGWAIEKMSKSMYNVVNPDTICQRYGADTLRMYEMFLGPLEQSKPWDTNGIDGVHRFLKKFWRLFFDKEGKLDINSQTPEEKELKILHNLIRKVEEDIENFSFNTTISAFMISVNQLTDLDCHKRMILEPLVILIAPYAPHIAEELWSLLGNEPSVANASFPEFKPEYIKEQTFEYPVSFNGKLRFKKILDLGLTIEEIERLVREDEKTKKYIDGQLIRKIIVVPQKIINIVI